MQVALTVNSFVQVAEVCKHVPGTREAFSLHREMNVRLRQRCLSGGATAGGVPLPAAPGRAVQQADPHGVVYGAASGNWLG